MYIIILLLWRQRYLKIVWFHWFWRFSSRYQFMTIYGNKNWIFLTSLRSNSFLTCARILIWIVVFTYKFLVQYTWFCWDAFNKPVYILTRIYELKTYKRKEDQKNKFSNTICAPYVFTLYWWEVKSYVSMYVFHIQINGGLFLGAKYIVEKEFFMVWLFELLFLSIRHFNRKLKFQCYHYYLQHPRHILPFVVDLFELFAFFCSFLPSFSSFWKEIDLAFDRNPRQSCNEISSVTYHHNSYVC